MRLFNDITRCILNRKRSLNNLKALLIFCFGLLFTGIATYLTSVGIENKEQEEFVAIANEINVKISTRLHAHALILRAGAAFFTMMDTVTREQWHNYNKLCKIENNLPGILGIGYAMIIPKSQLKSHTEKIRNEGYHNYEVHPVSDEIFCTSILYIEPFYDRNLRAFGYDMYTEKTRRRAMERSRDYDVAMLSGKVGLVQETDKDIQAGTLMYVPLYKKGMPTSNVQQRRTAIRGWVYSPYRMDDLMKGIIGSLDFRENKEVQLVVFDDSISESSMLFISYNKIGLDAKSISRTEVMPIEFNGKKWVLLFNQFENKFSIIKSNVTVVLGLGLLISLLLFSLSLSFFTTQSRSEQIKKQNTELSRLNAEKDKFFSIIAHDLKSLFLTIVGYSSLLVDMVNEGDFDGVKKFSLTIHESTDRTFKLLLNLIEWSRSQTGRLIFNPLNFDLVEVINEAILLFENISKSKLIRINKYLPTQMVINGDKVMISSVVRNLLSNALKFTPMKGEVAIYIQKNDRGITVSVCDNGVGIPQNNVDLLFKIDNNYTTCGTENEKGTGLGLILCKEFIEKHEGKIWVESEFGKSSKFSFYLPSKS